MDFFANVSSSSASDEESLAENLEQNESSENVATSEVSEETNSIHLFADVPETIAVTTSGIVGSITNIEGNSIEQEPCSTVQSQNSCHNEDVAEKNISGSPSCSQGSNMNEEENSEKSFQHMTCLLEFYSHHFDKKKLEANNASKVGILVLYIYK